MDRFLVQVGRDVEFADIIDNCRYENHIWKQKPRDNAHGEVKPDDELLIYCTNNVPNHRMSLALGVKVLKVSPDNVTFDLGEPRYFKVPLKRAEIHAMVDRKELPDVFHKCGQQGFNITKLDPDSASLLMGRLNGALPLNEKSGTNEGVIRGYAINDIIKDGCFLQESRLIAILDRLKSKKNLILQGPPGTGKTWLAKKTRIRYRSGGFRCPLIKFSNDWESVFQDLNA